jgi:hypothetical protein
VVVVVLLIEGLHVPVIPLLDVAGSVNVPPLQIGATCVNIGVVRGITETVIVTMVVVTHCPAVGVKVYVVVDVLFIAGAQVPVIPLLDVLGSVNVPPLQIGATCVKAGVVRGLTVTVMVVVVAHCPAVGVKVYVVVDVLFIAGLQVPVIPLLDVLGSVNVPPLQIGATCVNVGVIRGLMITVMVVVVAHCPTDGVKIYVVVVVVFIAGLQVPAIPLFDVFGKANKVPTHLGEI